MGLREYVLRRAIDSLVTFFFIFLLNFFVFFIRMEEYRGMTQTEQFIEYLKFVFVDRFGTLKIPGSPSTIDYVFSRLPPTLSLLISSFLLILIFSLVFGAIASYKHGKFSDLSITAVLVFFCMIPAWWLGFMISRVGIDSLGYILSSVASICMVPTGWFGLMVSKTGFDFWTRLNASDPRYWIIKYGILPSFCVLLCLCGIFFLVIRNSMVNIFPQRYITLAKAKGVRLRSLLFKHAMRNALLAITAMLALAPFLIVNQMVPIERIAQVKGVGDLVFESLISPTGLERTQALPTIQVIFLTLAALIIISHFILDVAQHVIDPRLKYPATVTDGGSFKNLRKKIRSRRKRLGLFLQRFRKNKFGLIGVAVLLFFVFFALFAPVLPLVNPEQRFPPYTTPQPPDLPVFADRLISASFFAETSRICIFRSAPLLPQHWLGTDELGRDVLSRLVWGARVSLFEGIVATLIALFVGCFIGLLAGYYQGQWFAYLLDRITEVFLSMPILVFIIYFPIEIGEVYYDIRAVFRWVLAVGLSTWAITAKFVRSQAILAKEKPCVEAAKAMGAGDRHIIWHYILPEVLPVMVSSIVYIATIVLALQSTLDFFGFRRYWWAGSNPDIPALKFAPYVSWGTLLSYGTINQSLTLNWWTIVPPAFCIAFLGLSMVLIGNNVADALNPEL